VSILGALLRPPVDSLPAFELDPAPPESVRGIYPALDRIAAVSNIHRNYIGLLTLLPGQGIIGRDMRWLIGDGHLVVVGDIFEWGSPGS
jgi:hypothetical protein